MKTFLYDGQFAHFMETLTNKEPGDWYPDFIKACEYWEIDPHDFFEAVTNMRLGQYKDLQK